MSLLLRKIETTDGWVQWGELQPEDVDSAVAPLPAVREFIPRAIDKSWISVFQVDDKEQVFQIAAAFAWDREKLDSGALDFAVADMSKISGGSFELRKKPGTTRHRFADQQHREIFIRDLASAERLTRVFLDHDIISFQGKALGEAARSSARVDQFDYSTLSQKPFVGNWQAKNLMRFIADSAVRVIGSGDSRPT